MDASACSIVIDKHLAGSNVIRGAPPTFSLCYQPIIGVIGKADRFVFPIKFEYSKKKSYSSSSFESLTPNYITFEG